MLERNTFWRGTHFGKKHILERNTFSLSWLSSYESSEAKSVAQSLCQLSYSCSTVCYLSIIRSIQLHLITDNIY